MKLLFIIDSFNTGGAQRQMVNLALGLTKRHHIVEFFCYAPGDSLAKPLFDSQIPIHCHIKHSRFSLDVLFKLHKIIQNNHFDLILSFLPTPNLYAIISGKLLISSRIPVIVSERRCDLPQGATVIEQLVRQFYRWASWVITNSHHQRDALIKKYPWLQSHISTIYNGYDLNYFTPKPFPTNNETLRILSIAHVSPHKNVLCLAKALKILTEKEGIIPIVDWIGQLVLNPKKTNYLDEINLFINENGLDYQWNWLNQRDDIVEQLNQHDLLVHPSFGEGLPNVVCEAMACGKPVILSDILDHRNLISHGKNGFLFNHRDPYDLAQKIKMVYDLPHDERSRMGKLSRAYAEENLSLDRFTSDYEELFKEFV